MGGGGQVRRVLSVRCVLGVSVEGNSGVGKSVWVLGASGTFGASVEVGSSVSVER